MTRALVPLNDSAPPYLPDADQVVFDVVPLLPVPEASPTVVPLPSLNEYAATRPVVAAPVEPTAKSGSISSAAASAKRGQRPSARACRLSDQANHYRQPPPPLPEARTLTAAPQRVNARLCFLVDRLGRSHCSRVGPAEVGVERPVVEQRRSRRSRT